MFGRFQSNIQSQAYSIILSPHTNLLVLPSLEHYHTINLAGEGAFKGFTATSPLSSCLHWTEQEPCAVTFWHLLATTKATARTCGNDWSASCPPTLLSECFSAFYSCFLSSPGYIFPAESQSNCFFDRMWWTFDMDVQGLIVIRLPNYHLGPNNFSDQY
jgi:hypothetical protein